MLPQKLINVEKNYRKLCVSYQSITIKITTQITS